MRGALPYSDHRWVPTSCGCQVSLAQHFSGISEEISFSTFFSNTPRRSPTAIMVSSVHDQRPMAANRFRHAEPLVQLLHVNHNHADHMVIEHVEDAENVVRGTMVTSSCILSP